MDFFGIGFGEILLIIIVATIIVGPGKIPEVAHTIGKTMHAFRKAASDFSSGVNKELEAGKKTVSQSTSGITEMFKQPLDESSTVAAKPGDGNSNARGKGETSG